MFAVHLSLHVAMHNGTFLHTHAICHSHPHEIIPIPLPISSQKAIPIPMRFSRLSHSHVNSYSQAHL